MNRWEKSRRPPKLLPPGVELVRKDFHSEAGAALTSTLRPVSCFNYVTYLIY